MYTELPVLTDPPKVFNPDAPKIHRQYENNLINHYPLRKGDIEKGFKESDFIHEEHTQHSLSNMHISNLKQ
ncbi:MAG: hypothetical protein MZV64_37230 [Ignavibacteriales bacterium]|nr:hypothetical protein [Ignavibacteriales bacterium]